MLQRKPIFSNVIEMNHQMEHVIGCCVYLIYDADEWILPGNAHQRQPDRPHFRDKGRG